MSNAQVPQDTEMSSLGLLHVWAGQSTESGIAERSVLDKDRTFDLGTSVRLPWMEALGTPSYQLSSSATLGYCHLLKSTLHFLKVQILTADLNLGLKNRLDLLQFVGIAGDEVDVMSHGSSSFSHSQR